MIHTQEGVKKVPFLDTPIPEDSLKNWAALAITKSQNIPKSTMSAEKLDPKRALFVRVSWPYILDTSKHPNLITNMGNYGPFVKFEKSKRSPA